MQHRLLNTLLCTGLLLATTVATAGDLRPECPQEARYGTAGNLAIPPSATDIEDPADVDEDLGPLITLYPSIDTSTDAMYPLPCEPSIGGELPPEVDEVSALGCRSHSLAAMKVHSFGWRRATTSSNCRAGPSPLRTCHWVNRHWSRRR